MANPVPGGGGRLAGLQGSLPRQSSTAPDCPRRSSDIFGGGIQGFRPGARIRLHHLLISLQLVFG